MWAAMRGHTGVVGMLLNAGADPSLAMKNRVSSCLSMCVYVFNLMIYVIYILYLFKLLSLFFIILILEYIL
jgi:hypothetical protein